MEFVNVALARREPNIPAADECFGVSNPPWSSVHVGMIQGGTARNIVAKDCAFHWEARGLPGLAPAYVADQLAHYAQSLHEEIFKHFPLTGIETILENEVPGLRPEIGSPAESLALRAARRNATIAVPYATEAGHFQRAGAPTVWMRRMMSLSVLRRRLLTTNAAAR